MFLGALGLLRHAGGNNSWCKAVLCKGLVCMRFHKVQAAARGLLDFLLPPRCAVCAVPILGHYSAATTSLAGGLSSSGLCAACHGLVVPVPAPACSACGVPLEVVYPEGGADTLTCAACMQAPYPFVAARAGFLYEGGGRILVQQYKAGDLASLAALMPFVLQHMDFIVSCDAIVPVPINRARFRQRGFNQAAALALNISRAAGVQRGHMLPVLDGIVERRAGAQALAGLSRKGRERGAVKAYRLRPAATAGAAQAGRVVALEGKHILLVDDVLTSGATAARISGCLLRGGAQSVRVLTAARVRSRP